ncbi:hypothetical protein HKX48_000913 [Thoreauomyces humboldtii]|nr:hypothetical protein HKX48_000913 [Thoreauomyces humboldtii]
MPAVTLQQHPATSALAAALQYHAMGQTSDASLELSATLTEILSCLNTGLISKEEYVNERNTALHAWAVRSEDRMILLKGLKDAWSAKMVTDQEYDALSASLFGSSSELFSSSIPSHAGMSDEMVGSWLGSSVPDDDMFGSSFPGVDASADMYQSHRQRQSHGQRRGE